jgi:hypothetical protein
MGAVQTSGCILVSLVRCSAGAAGPSDRVWLQEWLVWLRRRTALHDASDTGHPETVIALVRAGADVHARTSTGTVQPSGCILVGMSQCGAAGLSSRLGAAGVAGLAVQGDGAARCVVQRPYGDGDGAGGGGRRRAL